MMMFKRLGGIGVWGKRWPRVLVALVVGCLIVNLATRYTDSITSNVRFVQTIKDHPSSAKRQHLDKDAVSWVSPLAVLSFRTAPTLFAKVIAPGPFCCSSFLGESLYYRPPPSSQS